MSHPIGFISEHTAEYIIIPQLSNALEGDYKQVIPFYFWSSREGGIQSRKNICEKTWRMLIIYPRRPKVCDPDDEFIFCHLNQSLFDKARSVQHKGVPVIAAVPLIRHLGELRLSAPCAWFEISPDGADELLQLNLKGEPQSLSACKEFKLHQIPELISQRCKALPGEELIDIIRVRNRDEQRGWHGLFGPVYKPVYVLIR